MACILRIQKLLLEKCKGQRSIIIVGIVQQKVDIIIIIILYNVCNVLFNSLAEHV